MNSPTPQLQDPELKVAAPKPSRRVTRSLARHLRLGARARELYQRAEAELNAALLLHPPLGEAITLPDGRCVMVVDQFAQRHVAYSAKVFHRYVVADWKEPKELKASKEAKLSLPLSVTKATAEGSEAKAAEKAQEVPA